jgi:D-proline reductase (dithiol) PrdB
MIEAARDSDGTGRGTPAHPAATLPRTGQTKALRAAPTRHRGWRASPARLDLRENSAPGLHQRAEGSVMAIDSYRFLDFASRQIMKAWAQREDGGTVPFAPLAKPLGECTVALLSTAGIARHEDRPFDQDGERRNPWWGDPTFREIPLGTTERDVRLYHLHIDTGFAEADLDVVLPLRRLAELAAEGFVGRPAPTHYSMMGYILEPKELVETTAPAIAARMQAENVDAAALVPA